VKNSTILTPKLWSGRTVASMTSRPRSTSMARSGGGEAVTVARHWPD
jgi:hypothetical protein